MQLKDMTIGAKGRVKSMTTSFADVGRHSRQRSRNCSGGPVGRPH